MTLNEMTAEDVNTLPPTDTRRRPDVTCQENGNIGKHYIPSPFFSSWLLASEIDAELLDSDMGYCSNEFKLYE